MKEEGPVFVLVILFIFSSVVFGCGEGRKADAKIGRIITILIRIAIKGKFVCEKE